MDLIIIVVVIGALIGLLVAMVRYAGFIHQGPSSDKKDTQQGEDESDRPSNTDSE